MIFNKDFVDLIHLLQKHNCKFVLVGGLAVLIHGHFRTTKDMDIFYEGSEENGKKVLESINEFGFRHLNLRCQVGQTEAHGFAPKNLKDIHSLVEYAYAGK